MIFSTEENHCAGTHNGQSGLGILEIVIILAIITIAFTALLQLTSFEARMQSLAEEETRAYMFARQALEAARFVRDEDWSVFSAFSLDTPYYPVISSGKWTLVLSSPGPIDGYTSFVKFHGTLRDAAGNIADVGSVDSDTRHITAYVRWTTRGGEEKTISAETYLTNWQSYR